MVEEFEDPSSRYQNPRYSGKGVPNRSTHPNRMITFTREKNNKGKYTWTASTSYYKKRDK
jgi:hypothetical protein